MMELTGEIPGLLRFGSIVRLADDRLFVVTDVDGEDFAITIGTRGHWEKVTRLRLDLTSRTGRFHAREWLRDRGHDVGSEDRAEVLAWSVLSVWRGGRPLKGIAPEWEDKTHGWWGRVAGVLEYALVGKGGDWATFPGRSYFPMHCPFHRDRGNAGGKAAADAALIADGWALTNADGTLTLPPLPGAK